MGLRRSAFITRRHPAHPCGVITDIELVRCSLISTFGPSPSTSQGAVPSADFFLLARYVAILAAARFLMRHCLFCGSMENFYPPTATGQTGFLIILVNPFGSQLMSLLPHVKQISPNKDVNFLCTTTAFTPPPEPVGFVALCQLARRLSLVWDYCPSARTFAIALLSDPSSRRRPCL